MARFGFAEFFKEARRRRVFRTAGLYLVGAWVVVQIALAIFPALSISEVAIGYVWIAALLGFPVAVAFGWKYDVRGGRVVRTESPDGDPHLSLGRFDYLILGAIGVVAISIFVISLWEISNTQSQQTEMRSRDNVDSASVAVLPFVNMSGNPEIEYLADGITETLLHALAQLPELKVTARTSSFYYKGEDLDVRDIAAQLGVSKILEGSVQHSGNKIRIVAQLVEADSGFHLWSNTYDRELGDIFVIQDSIASNVATSIMSTVSGVTGSGDTAITAVSTTNLAAYEKYLQGLEQLNISSNSSLPLAESLLLQALTIDPAFYEARKELAYTYYQMASNGTISIEDATSRAEPIVTRLLEERPDDGLVIALDARVRNYRSINIDEYLERMIAAIEREPSETRTYQFLSQLLQFAERNEEAIDWLNRALENDPYDWGLHAALGFRLLSIGEYHRAAESWEQVTTLNPDHPSGYAHLARSNWQIGNYVAWYQHMNRALTLDPLDAEMATSLAHGLLGLGLFEESYEYLEFARNIDAGSGRVQDIEVLHAVLADTAQSLVLTESYLRREPGSRGNGRLYPAMVFASVYVEARQTEAALVILEEVLAGVTSANFVPHSVGEFYLQFFATIVWAQGKVPSEIATRLELLVPVWDSIAPFWRKNAAFSIPPAFLQGDLEATSILALDWLSQHENHQIVWLVQRTYPYSVVLAEPVIAARLAQINAELQRSGDSVRAHIEQEKL